MLENKLRKKSFFLNLGRGRIQSQIQNRIRFSPIRIQIKMIRVHNTENGLKVDVILDLYRQIG